MKKSKIIAVNATIFNNLESGAKRRFVSLYQELFNNKDSNLYYYVYSPKDCNVKNFFEIKYNNVEFINTNFYSYSFLQRFLSGLFFWNRELKKIKPDVFETFTLPIISSPVGKTYLTIHDIRYLKYPKYYSWFRAIFAKYILTNAIKNSSLTIVVSETIKKEIINYIPGANIKVIYNPIQNSIKSNVYNKVKKNIKDRFILSVGIIEKRKNYLRLIYALELIKYLGYDIKIIIVGKKSDDYLNLKNLILKKKLNNNIIFKEEISDDELKNLYAKCDGFIFQSVYEGFGIPVLESIINNCNVAFSNIDVFKEITLNKAFYFDPYSVNSIANALISLIENKEEVKLSLNEKIQILKQFEAKHLAEKMNKLYHEN